MTPGRHHVARRPPTPVAATTVTPERAENLQAGREVTQWAVLYYVSYMVAACYLLTNLLVGVVG
ncbi:hypothetical protein [Micromonospora chokoriensis]|uniref:Uncharacterized protein n=1 Tax=Micromonospora chokoriensis TaxID=356851 RepID=A0A1C4U2C1_9ACTN|nr:hypothetical protein [Micromonospora chokoriensis]SCE65841.1 hypothetical protein GA0070612_0022 [Micromonospora chokoriensis]